MNKQENTAPLEKIDKPAMQDIDKSPTPLFVEAERMFDKLTEVTRETALRAYDFFQQRGGQFGKEIDDWFHAESKILRTVPVEITETDDNICVKAGVPGFKPEEIEVSVDDEVLMMSGKTEKSQEKDDNNVIYTEWASDRFFRRLMLPAPVNGEKVKAELKDGILQLTLPKAAAREAVQVKVVAG